MILNHSDNTNSPAISLQSLLLAELEFRKLFLVHTYIGRKKLEDVISEEDAIEIISMKSVTMFDFEAKMWTKYSGKFCEPSDWAMHFDWDCGKTYLYHCYVSADGTYQFKMLYEAEDFATSSRKLEDIYNESVAIYHASYDYARSFSDIKKYGFAWKVAGEALCSFHEMKTPEGSISFKVVVLSMFT